MKLEKSNLTSLLFMIAVIIGTFSISSCKKEVIYNVGQKHAGGIIVSLDETQQHGLIMAEEDVEDFKLLWYPAKDKCESYELGNTDWRLPTKDEMLMIYQNKALYNLKEEKYWTSEIHQNEVEALVINFNPSYSLLESWKSKYCHPQMARPVKGF